jgi:hypothetical protein
MKVPATLRTATLAAALAVVLAALPERAHGQAETLKIQQLEQDVRDLRRTVDLQQRRLDDLERAAGRGGRPVPAGAASPRAPAPPSGRDAAWLQAANWERLRPGLGELEVVSLLGPPTSMRTADDGRTRTLFYALEIGSSGYLGGHVVLEDRRVASIELPRLK